MAALGDYVYVYWYIGTQYGGAGSVSGQEYTPQIKALLDSGYGFQTTKPAGGGTVPTNPNQPVYPAQLATALAALDTRYAPKAVIEQFNNFAVDVYGSIDTLGSNAVFNVETFGAVADNSTDCTAAIQAAIDAANAAGGGVVRFPNRGIYRINGPQRTGTSAQDYAYSGQLLLPARSMTTGPRAVIAFEGPLMAPQVAWQVGNEPAHTSGAVLLSNATTGYVIDGIAGSASFSPITNVFGVFNNLTIRTPNNPQCGGLNGVTLAGMSVRGCSIDVNAPGNAITVPTGTRYGLRLPANGNAAFVHVTDTQITGYPVGLSHGEHAQLNNVAVQMTGVGIRPQNLYTHGAQYERVLLQECIIGIQARSVPGDGGTIRGFIDFEDHPGTPWQSTCFIDDPDNKLYGHLEIYSTTPLFKGYPVRGCHKLNLSDSLNGAVGWMQSYPLDTFKRTIDQPNMVGTCDKSTHPWVPFSPWTTINTTADADGHGRMRSERDNGLGVAIVNWFSRSNQDSRTVLARLTMRAAGGEIGLIINRVSTNGNFLFVTLHNDGHVKIGKQVSNNDTVLAPSAGGLIVGGGTYKLAASFFHPIGTLPVVKAYLDGVEVASYTLTDAETAVLTEQDDTNIERGDGLRTWSDTQSYCSMFKVIPSVT